MASTLVFLLVAMGALPLALAQTTTPPPKKKKGAKPTASASASASDSASDSASASAPPPPAPPPPPPPPTPAPVEHAAAPPPSVPPPEVWDISNTTEDPAKRYYFIGAHYRGTIIPAFMEHIFVDEGKTIYSNSAGIEFDIRRGGQSMIPWIQYTEYSTGNVVFLQKNEPTDDAAYYSVINSSLKAIYIGIDELWSVPVANHLDFEYGFGVGLGFIFGSLHDNWVYADPNGSLTQSNLVNAPSGQTTHLSQCPSMNGQRGCNEGDHVNATTAKVGNYVEPNWFNGGSVPVIFPHIAFPQFSLRYKPIKQLETRFSLGFSLTGFWFGISADYGLEKQEEAAAHTAKHQTRFGDTL